MAVGSAKTRGPEVALVTIQMLDLGHMMVRVQMLPLIIRGKTSIRGVFTLGNRLSSLVALMSRQANLSLLQHRDRLHVS
jgi:hypothetical protein